MTAVNKTVNKTADETSVGSTIAKVGTPGQKARSGRLVQGLVRRPSLGMLVIL
ncbi:MAG: hypothetical protein QOI75_3521, partial [Pseudonocardiales bacterium]|nr:hypothetical protein [Pseudonocardiales bacterium]